MNTEGKIKIGLFFEDQACPACSSEIDKGGRMRLHRGKKTRWLKCDRCKYLSSEKKFKALDYEQAKRERFVNS